MKKLLLLVLLLPSIAFAQGLVVPGAGVPKLKLNQKLCFDSPTCDHYLVWQGSILWDGGNSTLRFSSLQTINPIGSANGGCDSSASPGNATCNDDWSGIAAVANGVAAVTITANQVIAARKVFVQLRANDTTCTSVKSVAVNAGNFVVTLNANCTAATAFSWFLVK